MKYFISEKERQQRGGSAYFEFQKGQKIESRVYEEGYWKQIKSHTSVRKEYFWKEDSMLLYMDIADSIELYKIVPDFNYYGLTSVDRETWKIIQSNAENGNRIIKEVIMELKPWADENFKEFDYFVIWGMMLGSNRPHIVP